VRSIKRRQSKYFAPCARAWHCLASVDRRLTRVSFPFLFFRHSKAEVASRVVNKVLSLDPPGRFLEVDSATGEVHVQSYERAVEKARQALRERKWADPTVSKGTDSTAIAT